MSAKLAGLAIAASLAALETQGESYKERYNGIGKRPSPPAGVRKSISRNERDRRNAKRKLAKASRRRNRAGFTVLELFQALFILGVFLGGLTLFFLVCAAMFKFAFGG